MIAMEDMTVLFTVISLVNKCDAVGRGLEGLVGTMEWMADLEAMDIALQEQPMFGLTVHRTFPLHSINCYAFARDNSLFSETMIVLFHESSLTPPVELIDDQRYDSNCRGNFLFATDLTNFKQVLRRLPRWSSHRIYCLIWHTTENEVVNLMENESELFLDAEIIIFIYGNWSTGYLLGQPVRQWYIIDGATDPSKSSWEINVDGYKNFYGREVKFSTTNCSLFSQVKSNGTKINGFDWSLFQEMTSHLNVTLKYVPPPPGSRFGSRENDSWIGGIIGNAFSGVTDVSFCGHWIESTKILNGIQISTPFQRMCMKYLVPRPKRVFSRMWYSIFAPFDGYLWLILAIVTLITTSALHLISTAAHRLLKYDSQSCDKWANALLTIIGTVLSGAWPKRRSIEGPSRLVVTGWVIFGMLMTTSFSSSLVSHLEAPSYAKKPDSIKDLVEMGYKWPEVTPGFPMERLLHLGDPYNRRWVQKQKIVKTWNEQLEDLKKDKRVIFGVELGAGFFPHANEVIPNEIIDLYETMDHCIAEVYEGFIYRDGSPFSTDFDFNIRSLRESGIVNKFVSSGVAEAIRRSPALGKVKKTQYSLNVDNRPLNLLNLRGIFIVLIVFHSASILFFCCEVWHHSKYSKNRRI